MKARREIPSSDDVPDNPEHRAAQWVSRCTAGLSPEEEFEFEAWLGADAHNRILFEEMGETDQLLDRLREPAGTVEVDPIAGEGSVVPLIGFTPLTKRRARWARIRAPVFAVAAALTLAAMTWWAWPSRQGVYEQSVATSVGRFKDLTLPDRSVVQINSDTVLSVRYSPEKRVVNLVRGEAFFTVHPDSSRPFFVEVGSLAVRAVGTAFNVRYLDKDVEVLVTEGKVSVDQGMDGAPARANKEDRAAHTAESPPPSAGEPPSRASTVLLAGQKVEIRGVRDDWGTGAGVLKTDLEKRGIHRSLAWRDRRLIFDAAPLAEVVNEFNRYNAHKIIIVDVHLGTLRFGGAFGVHEQATLVEALEQGFGIVAEQQADRTLLRKRPGS